MNAHDPAATRLLAVGGRELYQRNAFRITGLPTNADGRAVRALRQRVAPRVAVGDPVNLDGALPTPVRLSGQQILAVFDELGDSSRRLVDELLWFWDTPNATCGCAPALHRDHDAAVRAHARVLDLELADQGGTLSRTNLTERDQLWRDAAARWTQLLRRNDFWSHVRHRIQLINDRSLRESAVDGLRDALPRALVKSVVDLAAAAPDPTRLAGHAARWPVERAILEDLLDEAAAPLCQQISDLGDRASRDLEAGRAREAGAALQATAVPIVRRLDGLAPHDRHRRTATLCEGVAVLLNNCAMVLLNRGGQLPTAQLREWLNTARELVQDPQTRRTIDANLVIVGRARVPSPPVPTYDTTPTQTGSTLLPGSLSWHYYCLVRLMLDPVQLPGVSLGDGTVGRWADSVVRAGDGKRLYLLMRVWLMMTDDPVLFSEIHAAITRLWTLTGGGHRPGRGRKWTTAGLAGAAVVTVLYLSMGWVAAIVALVAVLLAALLGVFVIITRETAKIQQYFPGYPRDLTARYEN